MQHLTVEPVEGHENFYAVLPNYPDDDGNREPLRKIGSRVAAWHMACWYRFEQAGTLPKITPGDMFIPADGKGYTGDPRFAAEVPAEDVSPEDRERIERTITTFIRARAQVMSHLEPFGVEPEDDPRDELARAGAGSAAYLNEEGTDFQTLAAYNAADEAQDARLRESLNRLEGAGRARIDSESLSEPDGATTPETDSQARRAPQDDSEEEAWHNAYRNFSDLAESAPSESARAYWQSKADALLS